MPMAFDDEFAPLYTVGQVAGMLGVQAPFLRRIDVEDVVRPARSDGGQRRYSRADIALVQRVSDMAGEGMTLAGIRRILELEAEVADLQRQLADAQRRGNAKGRSS
ncbi:MAG: MerR family transcriptional regulator [Actinobacteria bacterium]|nr:MerR family transcriptional regulator [Actinomycetota bacterium]MBV8960407.1 MerR family transcriptional regulator [Actinomycetota bacterium]MBV9255108.1 MerR family transcriptional regulator [Actinomycetota bacterium]MBV9662376.1 MerR family transcriptional regulator [Actinomycetota bacterium]